MKILILSWRGLGHPNAGGAESATLEHAKGWVKAGNKVWLFTSFFNGAKKEEKISGVCVVRQGRDVFEVQIRAFFWFLFGSHPKFDLVVDEFHGIPFFTPIYVRPKKLGWIHEAAKEVWWLNPWPRPFNLIPGVVGSIFEPVVFKLIYRNVPFMTVSESTKKDILSFGIPEENITIVHNGVTIEEPKRIPKKEKTKTLMYLGALARDKGIEDAIRIFGLIHKTNSNWQFWVVGNGEQKYLQTLKTMVADRGIKNGVKFWGYVSQKKKFELLARAHVLINPSVREGWGLVNIEANAVGIPVVGYKVPGITDSVRNGYNGVLVDKGNVKEVARQITDLLGNENKYEKFGRNALLWSKKFSWDKSTKQSLDLINKIIL